MAFTSTTLDEPIGESILGSFDSIPSGPTVIFDKEEAAEISRRAWDDNGPELSISHPHGVRPAGNAILSKDNAANYMGLFSSLPDWIVLNIVEYCDAKTLIELSHTCKAFWAYCNHDPLWRDMALDIRGFINEWQGDWKSTYLKRSRTWTPQLECRNMFSDALFRPWQCGHIFWNYFRHVRAKRRVAEYNVLSTEEFAKVLSVPFILRRGAARWKAYREWKWDILIQKYGNVKFRAEAVDWTLRNYLNYMNTTQEESPLYLFDRAFVEKMNLTIGPDGAYDIPTAFKEDYFQVLGDERPDHRWLIVGPESSGSTFHKDPNGTSAWNAVVAGCKYWIMFPNSVTPPGVIVSEDQSEVTSPLSVGEWLLTYLKEARALDGCVEGVCNSGDIMYIPAGWWHLVVNLEPTIAITQNFVSKNDLRPVIDFLKNKPDQVSGFRKSVKDPYAYFMDRFRHNYPETYMIYMSVREQRSKRKWENIVTATDEAERPAFSFGFGSDEEEEEEEDQ